MPLSKSAIRDRFRNGLKPSENDFEEFIFGVLNVKDDLVDSVRSGNEAYLRVGFQTDPAAPASTDPSPTPDEPRVRINGGLQIGSFENSAARTNAVNEGTLIYDHLDQQLKIHDGSNFVQVGSGGGGGTGPWSSSTAGTVTTLSAGDVEIIDENGGGFNRIIFNAARFGAALEFQVNGVNRFDVDSGGTVNMTNLTVNGTFTDNSDAGIKDKITPFNNGLDVLRKVKPVTYAYKEGLGLPDHIQRIGVLAQDIEKIAPFLVTKGAADEFNGANLKVKTLDFIYLLINSVKTLADKVDDLENKLAAQ